jgi:hypothetical protein
MLWVVVVVVAGLPEEVLEIELAGLVTVVVGMVPLDGLLVLTSPTREAF